MEAILILAVLCAIAFASVSTIHLSPRHPGDPRLTINIRWPSGRVSAFHFLRR